MCNSASAIKSILIGLLLCLPGMIWSQFSAKFTISGIQLLNMYNENQSFTEYAFLLTLKKGHPYSQQQVRKSIDNLHQSGSFADIVVKARETSPTELELLFMLAKKAVISRIEFKYSGPQRRSRLLAAVYSLKKGDRFSSDNLVRANEELRLHLVSQGYLASRVTGRPVYSQDRSEVTVVFDIDAGRPASINKLNIEIDNQGHLPLISQLFGGERHFVPAVMFRIRDRALRILRRQNFLAAEIIIEETPLDPAADLVNVNLQVNSGPLYEFSFSGIKPRPELLIPIWEKKVFEKWAEEESRGRLLHYLQNQGYFDARVECLVSNQPGKKIIHLEVERGERYKLGQASFRGNRSFSDELLNSLLKSRDLFFDRLFWIRRSSLLMDLEILKLFYLLQGFPQARIDIEVNYREKQADITYVISENRRIMVESLLFSGNSSFDQGILQEMIQTRPGGPFVQRVLNEDLQLLLSFYRSSGFSEVDIQLEVSAGDLKSILLTINEGKRWKMGDLFVVEASPAQSRMVRRLFPLDPGEYFDLERLAVFQSQIESSAVFRDLKLLTLDTGQEQRNLLLKAVPDKSRSFGFGLGWEERKGLRGTVEYQEKNIFSSASALSAVIQLGLNERRGILSYDTPFFLSRPNLTSSLQLWEETEIFPSYKFIRLGFGPSIFLHLTDQINSIVQLRWHRTTLTELLIPQTDIDRLDIPFYTLGLSLSLGRDRRDNPFNPSRGDFLSSELRIGLPWLKNHLVFFKWFGGYQKYSSFLRNGTLSFALRAGVGYGDMSVTEKFFAGGSHSFRGTRNDRLGPVFAGTNQPMGGNAILLGNLEASFPLTLLPFPDLFYSIFLDIGNVFHRPHHFRLSELQTAMGFGLKYRTPMGPVRIDFAFNLGRKSEKGILIHIGIGNAF